MTNRTPHPWPFNGFSTLARPRPAFLRRLAGAALRHTTGATERLDTVHDRACVAFDIVAFGSRCRDDDVQLHVHRSLYTILEQTFEDAGISWRQCHHEDRGDGALIIAPAGTPTATLIGPVVDILTEHLHLYNKLTSDAAQIQLRMAVHTGSVYRDANGVVGRCLVHLFRLLEAPMFKHELASARADLGVVVSEHVYRDTVQPADGPIDAASYRPIEAAVKETRSPAWVSLADEGHRETATTVSR